MIWNNDNFFKSIRCYLTQAVRKLNIVRALLEVRKLHKNQQNDLYHIHYNHFLFQRKLLQILLKTNWLIENVIKIFIEIEE